MLAEKIIKPAGNNKKGGVMIRFTLVICSLFTLTFLSVASSADQHSDFEYPQQQWRSLPPSELGIDDEKINHLFDLSFADSATQAVVLIKDGFLVGERYAQGYENSSYGTSCNYSSSFTCWFNKNFCSTILTFLLMWNSSIFNWDFY